ncbi:Cytochrome c oxidase assembly protein COX20, mitochondrial [Halotydeus destructor]|nr:Cytochrome c oxidase assembly protein COX20, mitochondrial [Halotydeus destructor]
MSSENQSADQADIDDDEAYGTLKPVGFLRDRSFSETPCYRNSFLYGIAGGLGLGLTQFMFTSNIPRATRNGVFSIFGICLPYYFFCRHTQAQNRFKFNALRAEVMAYIEQQGSGENLDPEEIQNAAIEAGLSPSMFMEFYKNLADKKE